MRYKSFKIQNFKGIKETVVSLESYAGASVFAFVGLNESGKTTVLEAIHSFSPDAATSELLGGKNGIGVPYNKRVPRHLISEFTGDVSVAATLTLTARDKEEIARELKSSNEIVVDLDSFPDEVNLERRQSFIKGDFKADAFTITTALKVRKVGGKKWREMVVGEAAEIADAIYQFTPDIAYFPTFVFDFPLSIFLTGRGTAVDTFYRKVFQDILDYDGRGQTIEDDIVARVRKTEFKIPWMNFLPGWNAHSDKEKIQHVMDRAGSAVTKLIFGRWNTIFGEAPGDKEVVILWETVEGEKPLPNGSTEKTQEHDVKVKFQIRDGSRRFNVNDRSLGFRWFFSFMLFTQFRVARSFSDVRPTLFLFDEPASNLHAAAQQKLIESFPEIAKGDHVLAYSTHSHYMIEPKWLEQTFIVTNRADSRPETVLEEISLDDESLDVRVWPYRKFVNAYPSQISYFQPILDRLDVVPSRFDQFRPSVVLEGKSDYYILRYAEKLLKIEALPLIPGNGAGTFGALAALHVGWNLSLLFVLDGDKKGKQERERYIEEYAIRGDRIVTLDQLVPTVKVIEDVLDSSALKVVADELGLNADPTKSQIRRFFQERLASNAIKPISPAFEERCKKIFEGMLTLIAANEVKAA